MRIAALSSLLVFSSLSVSTAADWPQYRGDAERSGYTDEKLPAELSLAWKYQPAHEPVPAWPRDDRMLFDRAHDVVIGGGVLLFGTSADDQVIALDPLTGREKWSFYCDAPVRFAPAIYKDRAYVASDDGCMYCLSLADGAVLNKWRGGPSDAMILGNGRMVSRWPARGGPVIRDGVVYFGAGLWQSDGIFLMAIDAESGRELWRNDEAGKIYMPQPHGGANAESGVSSQGYFVATGEELIVPTGRAVPAVFWRDEGKFRYYHLQANGHVGGTLTVAAGQEFYNGGSAFKLADGALATKLGPGVIARFGEGIVHGGKKDLRAMKVVTKTVPDRKGEPVKTRVHEVAWSVPDVDGSAAVIVAGDTIFAGGGTMAPAAKHTVTAFDAVSKESIWKTDVDGTPYGLAVADGRLYVSTDRGTIYCYAAKSSQPPAIVAPQRREKDTSDQVAAAADEIIRRTGVTEGYCLDVDCGDGSLAIALAERTNLQIYALAPTADEVANVRRRLSELGLYGVRITVHQGDATKHRYGKYFADLIVSARSLETGPLAIAADNPLAALRPSGGVVCTGKAGSMQTFTRPALAKTGSWTHQYSDLGNTSCSTDELIQGELRALWFRDVDLEMPQRHGRGHAPLFFEGRMFVEGMDALRAVDAYNGRNLWEFALPGIQSAFNADHLAGTAVTGSNLCVAASGVYIHDKQRCYRLDPASGKKLGEFAAPAGADGKPGQWGYIACDGKRLFGTLANPDHKVRYAYVRADMSEMWGESKTFFVLDAASGKLLWRYDAEHSIRNNAIAIGSGKVFLIDRPIADEDKWDPKDSSRKLPPVKEVQQPPGILLAFDAATGNEVWRSNDDAFGTMLAYSQDHDALLMGYQSTRFKLPSEVGGKLAAFRGESGERLWEKQAKYVTRPLINDRRIYAQGGSWDLLTGDDQPFVFERSYGCGQLAGSRHMLLFRSATLGYLDLSRGSGVENFGGIRPGCWINALPVGGLVLVPDASAGCQCSYQNRSWMALTGQE